VLVRSRNMSFDNGPIGAIDGFTKVVEVGS